jgi:uncharacterized protein (TIGR03435 family)
VIRPVARLGLLICGTACGQADLVPRFEVASIKPADAVRPGGGIVTGHGRITIVSETLKRCIMGAYGLGPNQIAGGPAWMDADRFEIVAKSERQEDGDKALMVMLRTLLAERFNLVVHREMRTIAALVLETAKNGPKLEKAEDGAAGTKNGRGYIEARTITMTRFAEVLSRQTDLPVIDRTDLKGAFNLKLEWTPANVKTDDGPSLFTALQEQLGLRLEARKVPVEFLVIDHAEKPSEN